MTNCTMIKILKSPPARRPMLDLVAEMRPGALGPVPDYLLRIQGENDQDQTVYRVLTTRRRMFGSKPSFSKTSTYMCSLRTDSHGCPH